jgi:hypothetical protein
MMNPGMNNTQAGRFYSDLLVRGGYKSNLRLPVSEAKQKIRILPKCAVSKERDILSIDKRLYEDLPPKGLYVSP